MTVEDGRQLINGVKVAEKGTTPLVIGGILDVPAWFLLTVACSNGREMTFAVSIFSLVSELNKQGFPRSEIYLIFARSGGTPH